MTEPDTFYRDLRCELTDDEVAERAEQLAQVVGEREKLEREKAVAASTFGAALKVQAEAIGNLSRQVRDKAEQRPIEGRREPDYKADVMETRRLDTREVIGRRHLTVEERQGVLLPLDKPTSEGG